MKALPVRRVEGSREDPCLDRLLLCHSAALTFLGLTLGVFVSRRFFVIPLAVAATIGQELVKDRLIGKFGSHRAG